MKLIYIGGPFSAETPDGVRRNIVRASCAALRLWTNGWSVICPHKNTGGFEHAHLPATTWYGGDLEMLARCDALYLLDGWIDSKGAVLEFAMAKMLGKAVYRERDGVPRPPEGEA